MKRFLMAVAAALLVAGPRPAFAQERVTAPIGGISIEKPGGWRIVPPSEAVANLGKIEFATPEQRARVVGDDPGPLITFLKYPDTHPGIIPTIKVNYRPAPGIGRVGAKGILNAMIETLRTGFGAAQILDAPTDVMLAGQPAAHMRVAFTINANGDSLPTISEMWVIPRGNYMLVIGVAYADDEPAATHAEILAAIASVRIQP
jgi:hypothetical protein